MNHQNPYESTNQTSPQPMKSRPRTMGWLLLSIVLSMAHGLLNWWSVSNVSDGFWVMEGGSQTAVERLAESLTLLLNVPSLLICFALGIGPFGFTIPFLAITNSYLYGAALALLVFSVKKRRMRRGIAA